MRRYKTRSAHYEKLALGTTDEKKLAKYEAKIEDLEENIQSTNEQLEVIGKKVGALKEQAENAKLAKELAEKIANEKESTLKLR